MCFKFIANMDYSFIRSNGITITNAFQKILDESNGTPNKTWAVKAMNFTIDEWNHFCRIKIEKFIQCIMKAKLLLLNDSSEP